VHLAKLLVEHSFADRVFFCNSGAEANEAAFKIARKYAKDKLADDRYEIIATHNSFHGRTLATVTATGQPKYQHGFEPLMPGFKHVPYNDLQAVRDAISPATVAVLVEGVQGEGGVTPATPEYLLGLRALCDEKKLLLLMDGVQCGHFRTGRFQSFQRILEGVPGAEKFLPDGLSMAKSLGNGFPIGAFWIREPYADLLGAGTHGTTYGGNLLGCAVALKVFEIIERDGLADNARKLGEFFRNGITVLAQKYPNVIKGPRGLGMMIGIELAEKERITAFAGSDKPAATQFVGKLHEAGVLTIPAGTQIVRLLPALNLSQTEAAEGLKIIEAVTAKLAG
jgi:acetylornithine/succinyldiaminopimelate/putrescine aminotransferase